MPKSRISNVTNMSFNAIHENKILAKISEFTVNGQFYKGIIGNDHLMVIFL